MILQHRILTIAAAVGLVLGASGCATKKNLRAAIAPIDGRLTTAEKKIGTAEADIDALEKQLSQTSEVATGAEKEAKNATAMARTADGKAMAAQERANGAQSLAEKSMTRIEETEANLNRTLDRMYENLDNFQVLKEDAVTFAFNRAELTPDSKAKLDAFATGLKDQKRFIVEVQGFADPMGDAAYNVELSQKRAMAVVRYLAVNHEIPIRRIQTLGVGSVRPVADNKTSAGRMQNRRVEVKLYSLPTDSKSSATVASSL